MYTPDLNLSASKAGRSRWCQLSKCLAPSIYFPLGYFMVQDADYKQYDNS